MWIASIPSLRKLRLISYTRSSPPTTSRLQIKLRRDPQIQIHVKCIVVRHEGPRRRPAQNRMHHRRFDFDVAALVEKAPQLADDLRAPDENLARPFVDDQVEIPPPVTLSTSARPCHFSGSGSSALLSSSSFSTRTVSSFVFVRNKMARDADDVAQIQKLKKLEMLARPPHRAGHISAAGPRLPRCAQTPLSRAGAARRCGPPLAPLPARPRVPRPSARRIRAPPAPPCASRQTCADTPRAPAPEFR